MDYRDILKLECQSALDQFGEDAPTKVPGDAGYAKRWIASHELDPVVHDRARSGQALLDGPWGVEDDVVDFRMEVGYVTGTGNMVSLLVDAVLIDRDSIPLMTEYETVSMCRDCKGSSGGCPGFAPRFDWLRRGTDKVLVVIVHFDFAWAYKFVTFKGYGPRGTLRQLSYMDRLSDSYIHRIVKAELWDYGMLLGAGNCAGCHPADCAVIRGGVCSKPQRRTFSMEATGIDCDEIHYALYGEYLPWYYQGTNRMPTYMSRYVLVFCDRSEIDYLEVLRRSVLQDKSYIDLSQVPEYPELYAELMEVPHGAHTGYSQYVYLDP